MKRTHAILLLLAVLAILVVPSLALAARRSGGSFSGRGGFRSGAPRSAPYAARPSSRGGSSFIFLPGFGWGGGYGMGGGGFLGSLILVAVVGLGAVVAVRAIRRATGSGAAHLAGDDSQADTGRAYVYRVQLGIGRSGRGIQQRLVDFARQGDTSSEAGLAELLHQTALELSREKDSIRHGLAESSGAMSLVNAETKLNSAGMAERARYEVERVRSADGTMRRSEAAPTESHEVLEYIVVTIILATRFPLSSIRQPTSREELDSILAELGALPPRGLLGLEVVWTPADPGDSLTETDLMTTYPDLRSL